MDLLRQYDFDALAYIDKEYDNPIVKEAVHHLIENEMRSFTPKNYIAYMPYPKLKYSNSTNLKDDIENIRNGLVPKIDLSRYSIEKPTGFLEKDVQAWRKAITSAKIQHEHQSCRILNLEVSEQYSPAVWRVYNQSLEDYQKIVQVKGDVITNECDDINIKRKLKQEGAQQDLLKANTKRNYAIMKSWEIKNHCDLLEEEIKKMKSDLA